MILGGMLPFALLGAASAAATESPPVYDTAEECLEAKPLDVDFRSWICAGSDEGGWTPRQSSSTVGDGGALGTFVVVALLWSGVPLLIAASMASSRGESKASAVGLTLLLGWVGLAIVWFGQRKTLSAVNELTAVAEQAATAPPGRDSISESDPASGSPEARLRELDSLRDQGLINEAEYGQQRQRILDEI